MVRKNRAVMKEQQPNNLSFNRIFVAATAISYGVLHPVNILPGDWEVKS